MEPIISPWFIYLLGVVGEVKASAVVIFVCSTIAFIFYFVFRCIAATYEDSKEEYKRQQGKEASVAAKKLKVFVYLLIISVFLLVVTPSKSTIIGMIVAKNITTNNVKKAVEVGKDFKNEVKKDIMDIIQSVTKPEEKKVSK